MLDVCMNIQPHNYYIHLEIHLFTCKYNTVLHRACTGLVVTLYFDKVSYKPVSLLK